MNSEFCVAVHALVFLNHKRQIYSSERLADNICTNPARVRKIMSKLKKAGLVQTKEGAEGGYQFSLPAQEVSLGRICRALEADCISVSWRSGSLDTKCMIASGMSNVMDQIFSNMQAACENYLDTVTIEEIDRMLFSKTGISGENNGNLSL